MAEESSTIETKLSKSDVMIVRQLMRIYGRMRSRTGTAHIAGWANWYSGHLQALLGNGLGRPITRSEIVYLLCKAQIDQAANGSEAAWTSYYAKLILSEMKS
jgi:hypothetical protein